MDTYLTREEFQAGIKSMEHLVHQLVATDNNRYSLDHISSVFTTQVSCCDVTSCHTA